jgi:hypothetical protein
MKRRAIKRRKRKGSANTTVKLDPKIFTDDAERAAAEAMMAESVDEYGNEFFAALVGAEVKLGNMTEQEGEKRKKRFAKHFNKPKRKY